MVQVSETLPTHKEARSVISQDRKRGWCAKIAVIRDNRSVELGTTYILGRYDTLYVSLVSFF